MRIITDHGKNQDGTSWHRAVRAELDPVTKNGDADDQMARSLLKKGTLPALFLGEEGEDHKGYFTRIDDKGLYLDLAEWMTLTDEDAMKLAVKAQENLTRALTRAMRICRVVEMLVDGGHLPCITDPVARLEQVASDLRGEISDVRAAYRGIDARVRNAEQVVENLRKQASAPVDHPAKICEDRMLDLNRRIGALEHDENELRTLVNKGAANRSEFARRLEKLETASEVTGTRLVDLSGRVTKLEPPETPQAAPKPKRRRKHAQQE